MSTQPVPTPLFVDDAFSAVKTDEGTLAGATTAAKSAQDALAAAQAQLVATAQTTLTQAQTQSVTDLQALITAAQAAIDAIQPAPAQQ
jgi:hypothetical protein